MKRVLSYATVLALAVSGAGMFSSDVRAEDMSQGNNQNQGSNQIRDSVNREQDRSNENIKATIDNGRSGVMDTSIDAKTKADLQSRLASIVNNAVSTNGYDDLIGSLSRLDRTRLGMDRYRNFNLLNTRIDQFRNDFRDRYNQEFDLKSAVFDNAQFHRKSNDHVTVSLASLGGALNNDRGSSQNYDTHSTLDRGNLSSSSPLQNNSNLNSSGGTTGNTGAVGASGSLSASGDRGNLNDSSSLQNDANLNRTGNTAGVSGASSANSTGIQGSAGGNAMNETSGASIRSEGSQANASGNARMNDLQTGTRGENAQWNTREEAMNQGNPRSVDKRLDKVRVDEVQPDGTIVRDKEIMASRIHNPDLNVQQNPDDGRINPQVAAQNNAARIQPKEAHDNIDMNNNPNALVRNDEAGANASAQPGTSVQHDAAHHDMSHTTAADMSGQNERRSSLRLVKEGVVGNGWRLDAPDSLTAQNLAESLSQHIKMVDDQKASWPNDVNDAYKLVAQHVFEALNTVPQTNLSSDR